LASLRCLGRIPETEELCDELRVCPVDVLCSQLSEPITAAVLDAGRPRLRAVCTYAVGTNNIDVGAATERGVLVANTPGVLTDATADCAMALLLAAARRIVEGDMRLRAAGAGVDDARKGDREGATARIGAGGFPGWAPDYLLGLELRDAQLGIVGFGRIGEAVARRALGFGMRIATLDRAAHRLPEDLAGRITTMGFERLLSSSDVISLHCPLTPETRHLIDEAALRRMKSTAILVNTARGAVVDELMLVRALQEGWIAAAGLDVYENEPQLAPGLVACANAVLAPHIGSATVRTRTAMADLVAANTLAVLNGKMPPHCINPQAAG